MTNPIMSADRDQVLIAFNEVADVPSEKQVRDWMNRYPQFAEDIREHAEFKRELAEAPEEDFAEPDDAMLATARSRALNILHDIQQKAAANQTQSPTWSEILSSSAMDIPALARKIDIDRSVLAELNAGRMRFPIGERLLLALCDALDLSRGCIEMAIEQLSSGPRKLGQAKARGPMTINSRSYEEVINASQMTPEKKQYWLGD
ncbi:hypothetical protein ANOBCDAF_04415 [Pleomorphomonas sp. T1.2MG-36]|uniref:hypothetical protein n=1 Tax=Pleomorphomonas sp. T1.2MG-36 TaxID=3041167 RepID=UPI0024777122|nr:hypothetical protein [Pleomorphomonas sp. T1.2MG-36]CAI9418916.1 hypothetical protein ANOBCDAF_04415 [Pleomorphomonas sp. T1.2MG-36]